MNEQEALNLIARAAAELPLNDDDEQSELAALAPQFLTEHKERILSQDWRFNWQKVNLAVNVDGEVVIDRDFLDIEFPLSLRERLTTRGPLIWDNENGVAYGEALTVWLKLNLAWDDIPPPAQRYIAYEAAVDFRARYGGGVDEEYQDLRARAMRAKADARNMRGEKVKVKWSGLSQSRGGHRE